MHKTEVSLSQDKRTKRTKHLSLLLLNLQQMIVCKAYRTMFICRILKTQPWIPSFPQSKSNHCLRSDGKYFGRPSWPRVSNTRIAFVADKGNGESIQYTLKLWEEQDNKYISWRVRQKWENQNTLLFIGHNAATCSKEQVPEVFYQWPWHDFLLFSQDNCEIYFYNGSREIELFSVA